MPANGSDLPRKQATFLAFLLMSLDWLDSALEDLDRQSLRRHLLERQSAQDPAQVVLRGKPMVHFGSNDYLGLAADPRLAQGAQAAMEKSGWGSGASPLITGRGEEHARLEAELAAFQNAPAALLFNTGFAANVGAITALASAGDVIFSDAKNHASIIDGCRLSGAEVVIYRHADCSHLKQLLLETKSARRRLIVTDSLFSMDGDFAPLENLAELARQFQAMLLVDEAHATGVYGEHGRGLCEALGAESGVHVHVGTLSKALGSFGGFVSGSANLISWLANRARGYVFSTAMPEAVAAATRQALRIVQEEPFRRQELLARSSLLREGLKSAGCPVGNSTSQIIPVILGEPQRVLAASEQLRQEGFFVPAIRPPSVPQGESLLRISLSYGHSPEQIEQLFQRLLQLAR